VNFNNGQKKKVVVIFCGIQQAQNQKVFVSFCGNQQWPKKEGICDFL
jgi:hypothetical protein